MPLYHQQSRSDLRRMYVEAWRKRRERLPVEPVEAQIADVVTDHPEYQPVLENDATVERDYLPEDGRTNPFLHMGLHLAVRDQIATDRPVGIRAVFTGLAHRLASPHEAEHVLIDCLAEALWQAQAQGLPPDEEAYLARLRQRAGRS